MKLIMAVSKDGFCARGPDDKMEWTGLTDKAVFKLMTLSGSGPIFAGHTTYKLLPTLKGRKVYGLSRNGLCLDKAASIKGGWLIGGLTVALAALEAGYIEEVVLCHTPVKLGAGIPMDKQILKFGKESEIIKFPGLVVEIRKK